jgi:hypothetical protein
MGTADCDYVARGNTEKEVLQDGFAHASKEQVSVRPRNRTLGDLCGDNFNTCGAIRN